MTTKLTLNKSSLSREKKLELKKLVPSVPNPHLDKEITLDDIKKTEKWLVNTYPLLFTEKRNKPLKVGIEKDIFLKEGDALPCSRSLIRKTIGFYVYNPKYLQCILEKELRYNLLGEKAGTIEESHKENAQEILNNRKKKK